MPELSSCHSHSNPQYLHSRTTTIKIWNSTWKHCTVLHFYTYEGLCQFPWQLLSRAEEAISSYLQTAHWSWVRGLLKKKMENWFNIPCRLTRAPVLIQYLNKQKNRKECWPSVLSSTSTLPSQRTHSPLVFKKITSQSKLSCSMGYK